MHVNPGPDAIILFQHQAYFTACQKGQNIVLYKHLYKYFALLGNFMPEGYVFSRQDGTRKSKKEMSNAKLRKHVYLLT
jgi:hypothetical protein